MDVTLAHWMSVIQISWKFIKDKLSSVKQFNLIESHFTINKPSVKLHTEFYVNK